jgi:hypothetical protein
VAQPYSTTLSEPISRATAVYWMTAPGTVPHSAVFDYPGISALASGPEPHVLKWRNVGCVGIGCVGNAESLPDAVPREVV